jgi:hypothetical protein
VFWLRPAKKVTIRALGAYVEEKRQDEEGRKKAIPKCRNWTCAHVIF